jgi:transposase
LAITTSPDTILRRVKQVEAATLPPPRIVGIDDWAWRRGRSYGTIVVDLERGNVIDLLPDGKRPVDGVLNARCFAAMLVPGTVIA